MNLPEFANPPCLIKATYSINTPMFAGGANPNEAELTPTSFKGIMRFWWRALNWSKIRLLESNDAEALKELHKQESRLFGVATNNEREKAGHGACLINTLTLSGNKTWQYSSKRNGINYLMGQGLYSFKDGLSRQALDMSQTFDIEFTVEQDYHEAVIDVLKIIGLLGGLGSRSRHGFGSVTLKALAQKKAQANQYTDISLNIDNPVTAIRELLEKYSCHDNTNLPPLSAFYQDTRIDVISTTNKDALTLLNEVGEEEQMYRGYGRKGERDSEHKVNGKKAEQNFRDDHDLIINLAEKTFHGQVIHPRRVVFGLPHNYFYSSSHLKADIDASTGRRASPLLFHVHKRNDGQYQMITCLLKSKFLPEGESIKISANHNRRDAPVNIDWSVITDFMDRPKFANKETL